MISVEGFTNHAFLVLVGGPLAAIAATGLLTRLMSFAVLELPVSDRDSWLVRLVQRHQLNGARLSRLLAGLGVEATDYRRLSTPQELRGQLNRCLDCTATARCDALDCGGARRIDIAALEFCPNRDSLRWVLQRPRLR